MKIALGLNDYLRHREKRDVAVEWDTECLINPHILLCGKSGTGKTHLLRRMIREAAVQGARMHVFDVHGDIHIPGESRVVFSESTRYGYNPLVLNPDPHTGGVRRAINLFIATLNRTSRKLGDRQEAVLRALLSEVYFLNGCYDDNPKSWHKQEIDAVMRKGLIAERRYAELKQYYPCLDDLVSFAERKLKALYIGSEGNGVGARCITALDETNRLTSSLHRLATKLKKSSDDGQVAKREEQIAAAKEKTIVAFSEYVGAIETGRELDEKIRYDSRETLKSVVDRLKNLAAIGLFNPSPPPFDPQGAVWVYDIKHLPEDEQMLFTYFRMEEIFRQRVRVGTQERVREIIVSDEAHKFFGPESDNVYNVIAKEARKFGLGLWCASQSPTHFPEDFLTTVGAKILLGIDAFYWPMACRKLGIDEAVLKFITPHSTAAVHMDRKGELNGRFVGVQLMQERIREVRQAIGA